MLKSQENSEFDFNEDLSLEEYKMKIIEAYLRKYNNNIETIVKKLDIGRATLYRMIKRLTEKSTQ